MVLSMLLSWFNMDEFSTCFCFREFEGVEACRSSRGTGGKSVNHASGETLGKSIDYLFYCV